MESSLPAHILVLGGACFGAAVAWTLCTLAGPKETDALEKSGEKPVSLNTDACHDNSEGNESEWEVSQGMPPSRW